MKTVALNSLQVMLWRELKISVFSAKRLLHNYISPLIMVVLFAVVFAAALRTVSFGTKNVSYLQFILPGILALQGYQLFSITLSTVRIDKLTSLLPLIVTTGTPVGTYFVAKLMAGLLLLVLQVMIIGGAGYWITHGGFLVSSSSVAFTLFATLVGGVFWFCVGFTCGVYISSESVRDVVFTVVGLPVILASSVYYNVHAAPPVLRAVAVLNPLDHVCTILRSSLLDSTTGLGLDLIVITACAVIATAFAARASSRLRV